MLCYESDHLEMVNLVTNTVNVLSDEELDIRAVEEFKEDVDKLEEDIVSLQHWIKTQPHMSSIRQDSQFLRLFLRGCDYNLDTTKDKLDLFFSVRTNLPAWFSDWDPQQENIKQVMNAGWVYLPMRGFDKEGRCQIWKKSQSFHKHVLLRIEISANFQNTSHPLCLF